jgi:hypothetical protein
MFSCNGDNALIIETAPSISAIRTSTYWNMKSGSSYFVEVVVQDPQGFDNIETVTLSIYDSDNQLKYESALYDDGAVVYTNDGDKMAIDGIFTNVFIAKDIAANPGAYTFTAKVLDKDGNSSQSQVLQVIFSYSAVPMIKNISAPDTISFFHGQPHFFATVYDSNGIGNIDKVYFHIENDSIDGVLKTYTMVNDGTNGDAVSNDSVFTYRIDSTFAIGRKGSYRLSFFALNLFGQENIPIIHNIYFTSGKPVITKIAMPDSLERPVGNDPVMVKITVWVEDVQGADDIDAVYFYSKKPDGEMGNSGNPFFLINKGNGVYEIEIGLNSANLLGKYKFTFTARDKAENLSDTVIKIIEVY